MTCLIVHINHAKETRALLYKIPCTYVRWLSPCQPDCIAEFVIEVDRDSQYRSIEIALEYASIPYSLEILDDNHNAYCRWRDCRYDENGEMHVHPRKLCDPKTLLLEMQNLEHDPDLLIEYMRNKIKNYTPLPWINQDHYAKLHKLHKLIAP